MKELEVRGKTVEEAIKKGLNELGVAREEVEIKILDEGRAGLFGLMGASPAKVKLIIKAEGKEGVNDTVIQEKVKDEIENILAGMDIKGEVKTSFMAGRVSAQIKSDDGGRIIGKQGQTLDALQHLINLIINKQEKRRIKVIVDTEDYRAKRETLLISRVKKIADAVRSTGKTKELEPMSAEERKVIHKALKKELGVESYSKGEGNLRRVVIAPKE